MQDLRDRLTQLLAKKEWTAEDKEWISGYLENAGDMELQSILRRQFETDLLHNGEESPVFDNPAALLQAIHDRAGISLPKKEALIIKLRRRGLVAASVIPALLFVGYFLFRGQTRQPLAGTPKAEKERIIYDVNPGTNRATLMLDNGSSILLDEVGNGLLARQGGAAVIKSGEKLNYQSGENKPGQIAYNTIITPRGGQYTVELSDGTRVWLNAASSIRFPAAFPSKERVVEVTGEVYFEVAPLAKTGTKDKVPFIVKINTTSGSGGEIEVLGTHFNVMAYDDEPGLQATLLEGAVKFIKSGNSAMLKPGEQLRLAREGQFRVVNGVDLAEVVAWKNDYFDFKGLDFETIARQLSRWYNVDVVYNSKIDDLFYAKIPRKTKLSDVLKALENTGKIHFEIEATKIIVLP